MQRAKKIQALRLLLGHETNTKGNEVVFFCPKHGAKISRTEGQLSVNVETDVFNCWSCGFGGHNLLPLLKKGTSERGEYAKEFEEKSRTSIGTPVVQERKYDEVVLPRTFISLSHAGYLPAYTAAIRYLNDRGIGREDILKWKLGYCDEGEYKHRIIIPSFDEHGHLNFFTGRSYYDNPRRYLTGNFCKDIIYNDYLVDWNKPVVITEGPFDAFNVDENAIALQGSLFNTGSKLFSRIVFSGVDVYFAMDSDAFNKQLKIMETLLSYGVDCYYVSLGSKKDVGEMTKQEFITAKSNATSVKSSTDILRLRVQA